MSAHDLGFAHVWSPSGKADARTLLLLHGTGGDEHDLVPLARQLAPDANILSPRGKVTENGMPRFFKRLAVGVLDIPDLKARTGELAEFVEQAARAYGFDPRSLIAVGFSNGANIAVGLLFERPSSIAGAVLMRAMLPYEPDVVPALTGKRVLVLAGTHDPYSGRESVERLAAILREGGAQVDVNYENAGHELARGDLEKARQWLASGGR